MTLPTHAYPRIVGEIGDYHDVRRHNGTRERLRREAGDQPMCLRCLCRLSMYRHPGERLCWSCQERLRRAVEFVQ